MLFAGIDRRSETLNGFRDCNDRFVAGSTLVRMTDGPEKRTLPMPIVWDSLADFDPSVRRYPEKL